MMFTNEQIKQFIEQQYPNIDVDINIYSPTSFAAKLEQMKLDALDQILQMIAAVNVAEKINKSSEKVKLGFQLAAQDDKSTEMIFSISIIVINGTENEYHALFDADTGFLELKKVTLMEQLAAQVKEIKLSGELSPINIKKLHILIADDSQLARIMQTKFVNSVFNMSPFVVKDGIEAYKAAENTKFDILLLDNQMPGMLGINIAEKIRTNQKVASSSALIFLFTAEEKLEKVDLKVDGIYQKPLKKSYIEEVKKLYEEELQAGQRNVTTVAENKTSTEKQTSEATEEKIDGTSPSSSQSP